MELPDITRHRARTARPKTGARGLEVSRRARRPWAPPTLRGTRRALPARRPASSARRTRPFFIDKMPNNFAARRPDPPDAAECEDHRRAPPSAGLLLLGLQAALRPRPALHLRPRRTSAATTATTSTLMAHFDAVLPGRVHRVIYERHGRRHRGRGAPAARLLRPAVRGRACLRFYENERAVRTASSEQVRQPIYRDGVDQWRHFEPWLGPAEGRARPGPRRLSGASPLH